MVHKETEELELKKSISELKEAIISIAAILNKHKKGRVLFGIKNDGTVVGQHVTGSTVREISKSIADHIEPKIFPKIKEIQIEGKNCISVDFTGNETPYFAYGRAYARVGDENRQVSRAELERLLSGSKSTNWDMEVCEDASLKDINSKKLRAYLKKAGLNFTSVNSALKNLDLVKNGKPLNASILFFASNPQKFFPFTCLRCAYFPTDNTATILDQQQYEGDLLFLIEKAEEYVLRNIHIGMKLEGLRRIDVPEIDQEALREAIVNAFCHRDYSQHDSIDIAVFKDRVEIRNPGKLYGNLTIEKIKKEMVSERRNKLIAELLHRIKYIEKWGRGIKLILSKEPKTSLKEVGQHFIVTFKRKAIVTPPVTPLVLPPTQVTGLEAKILNLLSANPRLSRTELANALGIKMDTVKEYLKRLKGKKMLARKGGAQKGHWKVKR